MTKVNQELLEGIAAYIAKEISGKAHYFEVNDCFPERFWTELVNQYRVFDLLVSEDETDGLRTFIEVIRLVSQEFSSLAAILAVQGIYGIWALKTFGTLEQQASLLPLLLDGKAKAAFAFYEEGRTLGLKLPETTARQTETGWLLSGEKSMVSNSFLADQLIVLAQTVDSYGEKGTALFLVDCQAPGVVIGEPIAKSGLRALPLSPVRFEQVALSEASCLTREKSGLDQYQDILMVMRLAISAQSIGIAASVFQKGLEASRLKRGFGKRLIDVQLNQYKFADLAAQLASSEALYYQYLKGDLADSRQVSLLKLVTSRLVKEVAEEVIRITGAYSFITDNDLERYVRDAEILSYYGGSSERLKRSIAEEWL